VPLRAEFDFKESLAAQRLKVQRLQSLFAVLLALFIYHLVGDLIYRGLLALILLLVFLRARHSVLMSTAVERLVVQNKRAAAVINGQQHPLSAYGLDYFSNWLALVRLTTVAGQTYHCYVSPDLLGLAKYRQLIALLKAQSTTSSEKIV